jgi:hypothetical protein
MSEEELINKEYWESPEEIHPVPCEDCGSKEWTDWILLPHKLFNETCPGGAGYLCFPCFVKRTEACKSCEAAVANTIKKGVNEVFDFHKIDHWESQNAVMDFYKEQINQIIDKALTNPHEPAE